MKYFASTLLVLSILGGLVILVGIYQNPALGPEWILFSAMSIYFILMFCKDLGKLWGMV